MEKGTRLASKITAYARRLKHTLEEIDKERQKLYKWSPATATGRAWKLVALNELTEERKVKENEKENRD